MILYLVCDVSGSGLENGKRMIMRGLARTVEQYCRLGFCMGEIKLVAWSKKAHIVEWNPDNEFPQDMLDCKNTVNAETLIELLGNKPDGKILLVTDGFWGRDSAKALKRWKEKLLPDTLRIIKIGADANPQLEGTDVFSAEDLFAALADWLESGIA